MQSKHKASRLILDLAIPIVILVLLGAVLWAEQLGYQSQGYPDPDETLIAQDEWEAIAAARGPHVFSSGLSALLVVDPANPESEAVYAQFDFVLRSMGVKTSRRTVHISPTPSPTAKKIDLTASLPEDTTDMVFCFSDLLSGHVDAQPLSEWVSGGGHLLLAAGLEADELNEDWQKLLGIQSFVPETDVPVDSMIFRTALLAGAQDREFSDEVISCLSPVVTLTARCTIHAVTADDQQLPLLWELTPGQGRVIVSNADLMGDKTCRGLIAASYCRMQDAFVYPVINAAVYCIDDFPSAAPAGYDDNVLSQYGYTVGDFYANVWWPTMQDIARRNEIVYSGFLIQCYENNVEGPFDNRDNRPSGAYYARQLLESGGELGLHGYNHQPLVLEGYVFDEKNSGYTCWKTVEAMVSSVRAALAYAGTLADGFEIQAYVAPSNVLGSEAMNAMIRQFEDIRVFAGVYIGTPDQLVQEFSVLEDAVVQVPRLTADMQMESSEWWLQINELNYHFYESNYIHPDDILDEERSDGGDFRAMAAAYEEMVAWNNRLGVRCRTISQAAGSVQRYCSLSLSQALSGSELTIHADGLIDEAFLMLRTARRPLAVHGGELTRIDEDCYLLCITREDVIVELEVKP